MAAGTGTIAVPVLLPCSAAGHSVDAGSPSAELQQRMSSSPAMGGAGQDTLAGGEVGRVGAWILGAPALGWEGPHPHAVLRGTVWGGVGVDGQQE